MLHIFMQTMTLFFIDFFNLILFAFNAFLLKSINKNLTYPKLLSEMEYKISAVKRLIASN